MAKGNTQPECVPSNAKTLETTLATTAKSQSSPNLALTDSATN